MGSLTKAGPVGGGLLADSRCAVAEDLWCQVKELQEVIRNDEEEIDQILLQDLQVQVSETPDVPKKGQTESMPTGLGNGDSYDGDGWKPWGHRCDIPLDSTRERGRA